MDVRLSIIMITVPDRSENFNRLKSEVIRQIKLINIHHRTLGGVEIVEVNTPKVKDGGESIGKKREQGLRQSKGEYVIWLDDDDWIAPDYVEQVLRMANKGADVCTFNNLSKFDNFWMVVIMSLKTKHDDQARPGIINRRPWHVCAWRRSMIADIEFINANWDEDTAFIAEALKRAITEVHIDNILHEYNRVELESLSENNEKVRGIIRR